MDTLPSGSAYGPRPTESKSLTVNDVNRHAETPIYSFEEMLQVSLFSASISVATSRNFKASPYDNPQIEPYIPIIDIPKI